jgi:hypothetical protein
MSLNPEQRRKLEEVTREGQAKSIAEQCTVEDLQSQLESAEHGSHLYKLLVRCIELRKERDGEFQMFESSMAMTEALGADVYDRRPSGPLLFDPGYEL